MTTRPTAVTGASGHVGGAVVRGLVDAGHTDVLALVREPSRFVDPHQPAAVRRADYTSREEMAAALTGVGTLVFISSDGEAASALVHHINVLDAAVRAEVEHVVYLSILDLEPDSPFCFAPVHRETERMLRDRHLPHTVVRASVYGEFFTQWVVEAASSGSLALPMGDGRVSLVSRGDVARCLVECAIRRPGAVVKATGGHSFDLAELADITARFSPHLVKATNIEPTEFSSLLLRRGVAPWWVYAFTSMFESVREQRFEAVTGDVATLTGLAPVGFSTLAETAIQTSRH
ncbi:NAD(P)H-binding protein [Streptomyces sp. N2-109]|uniref:NAD(P)H-binding protein n=1 Tax=Streptomyces gossypii TaxID=2883101 RepID=A0ABT2K3P3_9ACTN|nr:NAD(P)H-binding protein [Streptomyces gossypii]MCT2594795.1 NAD(P)H-binding protein [Streptomyces gossypii]